MENDKPKSEKRKVKRQHLVFYMRVFDGMSSRVVGHLMDLSERGLMLLSDEAVAVNEEYRLRMRLPREIFGSEEIVIDAVSRWCKQDDNPDLCGGFDLMWQWIELASGGTRVHSKDLLIKRLREQRLHPESFKFHLQVFDYGMPPHAGWAIGLDRLMMALTGKENIREVVLFPRDRFRLTP